MECAISSTAHYLPPATPVRAWRSIINSNPSRSHPNTALLSLPAINYTSQRNRRRIPSTYSGFAELTSAPVPESAVNWPGTSNAEPSTSSPSSTWSSYLPQPEIASPYPAIHRNPKMPICPSSRTSLCAHSTIHLTQAAQQPCTAAPRLC